MVRRDESLGFYHPALRLADKVRSVPDRLLYTVGTIHEWLALRGHLQVPVRVSELGHELIGVLLI